MTSPPPSYTSSSSLSRSKSSGDDITSMADMMLRSSLSKSEPLTSEAPDYPTLTKSDRHPGPATPSESTTSRTRERLRQLELELEGYKAAQGVRRDGSVGSGSGMTAAERKRRLTKLEQDKRAADAAVKPLAMGTFKKAYSTDLLFLIDTTGSMGRYIDAAKNQVKSIMDDIKVSFLNEAEVRIAVVGYKDHGDTPNIEFLDFTTSSEDVRSFLDKLKATGGADAPEDVLGGIKQAIGASWKHSTRCIIHITDAPPHGRNLHDLSDTSDYYPEPGSEPHGLTHGPLLKQMIGLNLNYALLRITRSTDRMAFVFLEAYNAASADCRLLEKNKYYEKANGLASDIRSRSFRSSSLTGNGSLLFEEHELGIKYSELRHLVVRSVSNSASRTAVRLSESRSRDKETDPKASKLCAVLESIEEVAPAPKPEMSLEVVPAQWDSPMWFSEAVRMEGFSPEVLLHSATTLNTMLTMDENIRLSFMELTIRKRPNPFAEGALRQAYYARTPFSTNRFVVKAFKKDGKKMVDLAEDMRCQALCKAFALEFNALVGKDHSIDFIVTTCLQPKSSSTTVEECMSLEPYIEGEYVKYNGNNSYVNHSIMEDPVNQAAQAFSHFTYERSCGHFLVCDLQGVGHEMTDPAIHTLDPTRFRLADTNLGQDGFKFFFATHECNSICKELELKSNRDMIISGTYEFRDWWPTIETTVCCSNKLCGKIVTMDSAQKSPEFRGCHWCEACWPQLQSTMDKRICTAPGPDHEFEVSRFFYESQGRVPPQKCPEHTERDTTVSRTAAVGGNLWNRLGGINKKKSISGKNW